MRIAGQGASLGKADPGGHGGPANNERSRLAFDPRQASRLPGRCSPTWPTTMTESCAATWQ